MFQYFERFKIKQIKIYLMLIKGVQLQPVSQK